MINASPARELIRKVYGTQAEFARRIGSTDAQVSRWLSGAKRPSWDNIDAMCAALNCQPGDLLVYVPESSG